MPPDIPLKWMDENRDRARNYSAPGGAANYIQGRPRQNEYNMYNRYVPLFPEYSSFPTMGRGKSRGRARTNREEEERRPGPRQ